MIQKLGELRSLLKIEIESCEKFLGLGWKDLKDCLLERLLVQTAIGLTVTERSNHD